MSAQPLLFAATKNRLDVDPSSSSLKNKVLRLLYHWPWFVLAIITCICAAFLYLKISKAQFELKSSVLIQDQKKTPDNTSALREIDLLSSSKIIENELEIIKSKRLIDQVILDLGLWVNYSTKENFFKDVDLYKNSPVKFTLISPIENMGDHVLEIMLLNNKEFEIIDKNSQKLKRNFGAVYKDAIGTWKIDSNPNIEKSVNKKIKINLFNVDALALKYQKTIDAVLSNKLSTSVVLSLTDNDAERGKDILNTLMFNYNLASSREKLKQSSQTLDFLNQKIDSSNVDLTATEKGIEGFKSSRGLTDIGADSKVILDKIQTNEEKLNAINIQLNIIEQIQSYVNSEQNSGRLPATIGIEDARLNVSIQNLADLQLQKEKLLATTPETNPSFDGLNRQIQTNKKDIKDNVKNIFANLLSTQSKLTGINNRLSAELRSIPGEERQFGSIKRKQETKEGLYSYLLKKREEIKVSYATTQSNDRIIDNAYVAESKGLKKTLTYLVALFIGVAFPSGIIYGKESFKNKILDRSDIENAIDMPIIAEISQAKGDRVVTITDNNTDVHREQFRNLRTRLYYLHQPKHQHGRVLMITSSVPGEGKSYISTNLSIILAYSSRKTILLELDLRKPRITEALGLPKVNVGLTDYLSHDIPYQSIIHTHKEIPNLSVISAGDYVNNPSELLETRKLEQLIQTLKEQYDDVIIDSPPMHLVTDALILSKLADLTLYVIRQGFTGKEELTFIKEVAEHESLNQMQIVFNGIQRTKYGYGYKYDNRYYQN